MPYSAADLLADLQQKVATAHPDDSSEIEWKIQVGDAGLKIDPQVLLPALTELFENAFRHCRGDGNISVEARVEQNQLILTLREPKKNFTGSPENWGREPFRFVGRGHYGLGLHRSLFVIQAHGGELKACFDSPASLLVTTVVLPLAS
jgi:K+-sensing histidine kinase KdpD